MQKQCKECGSYKAEAEGTPLAFIVAAIALAISCVQGILIMNFGMQILASGAENPHIFEVESITFGTVVFIILLFSLGKKNYECKNCGYTWKESKKTGCIVIPLLLITIVVILYSLLKMFF
jgi:hypothetical protein